MPAQMLKSSDAKRADYFRKLLNKKTEQFNRAKHEATDLRAEIRVLKSELNRLRDGYSKVADAAIAFQKKLKAIEVIVSE